MPNDALPTYLQDHLAGALHAIELLKAMQDHFSGEPLGTFAGEILAEVEADREVLARLTERTGGTAGGVKEWGAWLAEKVSRIKLKHRSAGGLGTFEALEFLVIGVHGKRALWRAMAELAPFDARLQGVDFGELAARAENQHQKIGEDDWLALTQSSAMATPTESMHFVRNLRDVTVERCCRSAPLAKHHGRRASRIH